MKGTGRARDDGRSDAGAIGIGTMIVFIAMVIVAAVAAAVLINTAGTLQRKSTETGKDTTQEVSGNIFIRDIVGNVTTDGTEIRKVWWYVSLAPGAKPVDLKNTIVRWTQGNDLEDLQHNGTGNCASLSDGFCIVDVFDAGDNQPAVLQSGDRVRVEVALNTTAGEGIPPRTQVDVMFIPEQGSPITGSFETPASFGRHKNVGLV